MKEKTGEVRATLPLSVRDRVRELGELEGLRIKASYGKAIELGLAAWDRDNARETQLVAVEEEAAELRRAAEDMLSVFADDGSERVVTPERMEAWRIAVHGGHEFES